MYHGIINKVTDKQLEMNNGGIMLFKALDIVVTGEGYLSNQWVKEENLVDKDLQVGDSITFEVTTTIKDNKLKPAIIDVKLVRE